MESGYFLPLYFCDFSLDRVHVSSLGPSCGFNNAPREMFNVGHLFTVCQRGTGRRPKDCVGGRHLYLALMFWAARFPEASMIHRRSLHNPRCGSLPSGEWRVPTLFSLSVCAPDVSFSHSGCVVFLRLPKASLVLQTQMLCSGDRYRIF